MTGRRSLPAVAVALVALASVTTGCGGGEPSSPVATNEVTMVKSYRFDPEAIEVDAGQTVTWTNEDNFTHSVQVDGQEDHRVERGESVSLTFDAPDLDDIALQAADDALVSVLARVDDFRGASRFTTWVYKFALLEAAVKLRRSAWQGRELPPEPESWDLLSSTGLSPAAEVEQRELLETVRRAIADVLTPHQRRVLVALALDGVPIDVLAERLGTTRGALYKTLHDARRKLRAHLRECGLSLDSWLEEEVS